jgi:hypothetical protein
MKKPLIAIILTIAIICFVAVIIFFFFTGLKIEGNIIDNVEKKPVAAALVELNNKEYQTDKDGYFKSYMPVYPPVKLSVSKNGYRDFSKTLSSQWFLSSKKFEILLEPLSYAGILDNARKDLSSYHQYSFRYTWFSDIGEKEEKHNYMIYQLGEGGMLRFKYLQDDRLGNLLNFREIIRTPSEIFYSDDSFKDWIKIREEEISLSKMQDPFDILQIFQEENAPSLFIFEKEDLLYDNLHGILYTMEELQKTSSANETSKFSEVPVKVFFAEWVRPNAQKRVVIYLNENYQLQRADLSDEASDSNNEKKIKQSLTIYITSINQNIPIIIPSIE